MCFSVIAATLCFHSLCIEVYMEMAVSSLLKASCKPKQKRLSSFHSAFSMESEIFPSTSGNMRAITEFQRGQRRHWKEEWEELQEHWKMNANKLHWPVEQNEVIQPLLQCIFHFWIGVWREGLFGDFFFYNVELWGPKGSGMCNITENIMEKRYVNILFHCEITPSKYLT